MKGRYEKGPVKDGVQEYCLESWKECFGLTTDLFARGPAYVYRGQCSSEWPVVSSLDRLEKRFPKRKNLSGDIPAFFDARPLDDKKHLDAFRRAIRGRLGQGALALDDDTCWALGQHHGLATPLVDWTRSPFIALFFAFDQERVCGEGDRHMEPEYRALFALSTGVFDGKPTGGEDERIEFVSPLGDDNYRLISQGALLVRLPRHTDLESCVRKGFSGDNRRPVLMKFKIPNSDSDRHDCLIALNKMGINHMTLFPDVGGAARHVNSLWEPGHEDVIAWL